MERQKKTGREREREIEEDKNGGERKEVER